MQLQKALSACSTEKVEIARLSKPGASIRWGLPLLKERFSDPLYPLPDIVIVEFSGNDATIHQGLPLHLAKARTLEVISLIQSSGSIVFLSTMNPGWGKEAINRLGQAQYHGGYRDLAAETGAGLIDTVPQWQALSVKDRKKLVPDNAHPSDAAAALITVPAFFAALRPFICTR